MEVAFHEVTAVVLAHAAHHHHEVSGSNAPVWSIALGSLIVGFFVGLTGSGGGALMTPMLVLLFGVSPSAAVSSDLLASLVMKPVGGGVHLVRRTVNWRLVWMLCVGSVPAAVAGVLVIEALGTTGEVENGIKILLGWALLVSSAAMLTKGIVQARIARRVAGGDSGRVEVPHRYKPVPTVLLGVVGGFMAGMTSVGSGSLMIAVLMLLYPRLKMRNLVGTDLIQAIPLVGAATLVHLGYGDVSFGLTGALLLGALPGTYAGARLSSRAADGLIRPALVLVLCATAFKLLGMHTSTLGLALGIIAVAGLALWGAADATLRDSAAWHASGRSRVRWVSLQAIGAPFGVGFAAALYYFARVRPSLQPATPGQRGAENDRKVVSSAGDRFR